MVHQFNSKYREIFEAAVNRFPGDNEAATDYAFGIISTRADYPDFIDALVKNSIRGKIEEMRCSINQEIKRNNGGYRVHPKVRIASKRVAGVYRSCLQYMIAGRTLGQLFINELPGIAEAEKNRADGHLFNSKVCLYLHQHSAEGDRDKRVEAVWSERKTKAVFRKCSEEGVTVGAAAEAVTPKGKPAASRKT